MLLALVALGACFLVGLLGSENRYRELALECERSRVPCAWDGALQWAGPFVEAVSGAPEKEVFSRLSVCLEQLGVKPLSGSPPGRAPLTGSQLAASPVKEVTRLEAAGYLLGCALVAGLDLLPCATQLEDPSQAFAQRTYGVCRVDEQGRIADWYIPFSENSNDVAQGLTLMSAGRFAAHFIGATAEAEMGARESYRLFARALTYGNPPEVLFRRGVVKARNGAVEFGVDDMREALRSAPSAPGHTVLGDVLMRQGVPDEALSAYSAAITLKPDHLPARVGKARALLGTGAVEQAESLLEALRAEAPAVPRLHAALATCYRRRGETDKALVELREEIRVNPVPDSYQQLADFLSSSGKGAEGVAVLEEGYELLRTPAMGTALASSYAANGQKDKGMELCRTLTTEHADRFETVRDCSHTALWQRELETGEAWLTRAVQLAPHRKEEWAWLYVARLDLEKKGKKGTKSSQETLGEMMKRFASARRDVAFALLRAHYVEEAQAILREGLEQNPADGSLLAALYYTLRRSGLDEEAEKLKEEGIKKIKEEDVHRVLHRMKRMDAHLRRKH